MIKKINIQRPDKWLKKINWVKIRQHSMFKKSFRLLIFLLLLSAIGQFVFLVLIYGFHLNNKITRSVENIIPYPAAVVNQDIVSISDYNAEKDYIYHFYQSTNQGDVNFETIDAQILDQLVENKIIAFEAWRNKIKVTNRDIDNALATVYEQNGGQEKVEKVLNDLYGLDSRSFRHLIKNQLLRDKVNEELIMRVTASHILVRVDKDAPDDKAAEAKTKIDGYLNEARSGSDFAELAKKYSEDTGSNEQGGKLEPFAQGEMVEEFSKAAFATPVGQISDPVETDFGWHIIKVESNKGKIALRFSDWLSERREKSLVWKLL